jgi:hypothetical protein
MTALRAPSTADYAELILAYTDVLLGVLRGGDADEVRNALDELRSFRPPHGVDHVSALLLVLAAQIDPASSAGDRAAWALAFDPTIGVGAA